MKRLINHPLTFLCFASLFVFYSCKTNDAKPIEGTNDENTISTYTYSVSLKAVNENYLAPALQSYVHAQDNDSCWLLFAGRTNGDSTFGGLHNLKADYTLKSFPPKSFNPFIYTFNPKTGNQSLLNYWNMLDTIRFKATGGNGESKEIKAVCQKVGDILARYGSIFMCSNPQAVQSGDYLYVVGGYGPPVGETPTKNNYTTFGTMAKINVPLLMRITNRDWNLTVAEWNDLFRFGNNSALAITGGELKKVNDHFYLAGGHNFDSDAQVYLNCVYQFNFSEDNMNLVLTANITDTISDLSSSILVNDPKKADSTSVFRRRDLPVVPSVYLDNNGNIAPNFALMTGVFTYHFAAWNDAIYITPNGTEKYVLDTVHDQKNCNVYSCPDFVIYDPQEKELHTFLPGGIGNGNVNDSNLSGFTNTLGYSKYNVSTKTSSFDTISNAFLSDYFYGAEAEFFPNSNAKYFTNINGTQTDVINGDSTFSDSNIVHIGYIYGGIESYEVSPSTYGSGKSGASNKVWKVMVTRNKISKNK